VRAALFVQQVHVNALILDCGMDFDGDKDKAEGKDALVPIRTRHIVNLAGGYPLGYRGQLALEITEQ
jgi:hypothetical protein